MRPGALVGLLLLAGAGVMVSTYLTIAHFQGSALVCTTTGVVDCGAVTSSSYSMLGDTGIPVAVLGLLWFMISGALAAMSLRRGSAEPRWVRLSHLGWATAGLGFVLYLVWAELVMVHRICEWCSAVHLLVLATFLLAVRRVQSVASEGPAC